MDSHQTERKEFWRHVASSYTKDYGFNYFSDTNDADASINYDLREQKVLAEELAANHPVAKSIINNATNHTVLSGLTISVDTRDDKLNDILELLIKSWSKSKACDATKRSNLDQIFETCARNLYLYGETLGLIVNTNTPYSVAFRGIPALSIDTPTKNIEGRIIKNGIEVDKYGEPKKLWIKKADESGYIGKPYFDSEGNPIVLHAYTVNFFGQTHGQVPITACYKMLLDLSVFVKSEVNVAANSSQINIIQKLNNPEQKAAGLATTEVAGSSTSCARKVPVLPIRPNMTLNMSANESIEQFKLERPSAMFQPFTEYVMKIACASIGLSYEYLFTSWQDSNYSSAKINALQTQAVIKKNQKLLIENMIEPLVFSMVRAAYDNGLFETDLDISEVLEGIKILPPKLPLLDEQREIAASVARIAGNLSTHQIESERLGGGDYSKIFQQLAREKKELGVSEVEQPAGQPGKPASEGSTRG